LARRGRDDDFLAVLDPDVVLRADRGAVPPGTLRVARGARAVAEGTLTFSRLAEFARPALVNGAPGIVSWLPRGRPLAVMGFTVRSGKIVKIDIVADPARLRQLDLGALHD
jgi:RNA polymerase sigma-70 factor, ECF subfamily